MKQLALKCGSLALVDDDVYDTAKKYSWVKSWNGYVVRYSSIKGRSTWEYLHLRVLPRPNGLEVDHINRNKMDNRRCNLRISTRNQNSANMGARRRNKLGFKGISVCKKTGKFCAELMVDGKRVLRKRFWTLEEAVSEHRKASIKHCGSFSHYHHEP